MEYESDGSNQWQVVNLSHILILVVFILTRAVMGVLCYKGMIYISYHATFFMMGSVWRKTDRVKFDS
jgi:hypothetical protein